MGSIREELITCFTTSFSFLKKEKKAMLFLQAKLSKAGMPGMTLGFALFLMEMGGILGAKIILYFKKLRYRCVFAITALLVLGGVLTEHSGGSLL